MNNSSLLYCLLALAAVIILISVIAYNRHMDKVTKGEVRDTHSSIPEPKDTVNAVYRILLMVVVILSFITLSTLTGTVSSLQHSLERLSNTQNSLNREITALKEQLKQDQSVISDFSWNILRMNHAERTAQVEFRVSLKEYAENASVAVVLNDDEQALQRTSSSGIWSGECMLDLFADYAKAQIRISQDGNSANEDVDFPETLFSEVLPMPSYECSFTSDVFFGKLKYGGSYTLSADHLDDIESVTVAYLSDGKELKTNDITKETLNHEAITLEKGLKLGKDLTFRTTIVTKSGFKIIEQMTMIYQATPDFEDQDSLMITDLNDVVIWMDRYGH